MNIYLCGVGGQGIGLLSEVMIRTAMDAGYNVLGADTHGLAQRGGTVVSHLRIGDAIFTPLVPEQEADLILALERFEALRAMAKMLRPGGTLIYYDTAYQPISVREGREEYPSRETIEAACKKLNAAVYAVCQEGLPDPRMQNVALIGKVAAMNLIEGFTPERIEQVLASVAPPRAVEKNLEVFRLAAGKMPES